ncbi:MAG: polysaccharide deacetylase family protein [Bacteroidia bacterium]|nr:polysaccharide deacetylase family protein [Bacteroidia bacterium]MCZ2277132.1 polysaccharide deacetylase family protein [Bacteroidia bacterium]
MSLLVYTSTITPRLHYTFSLLLREIIGTSFRFTCSEAEFISYAGPKFSYCDSQLGNELFFYAHRLLFERGINEQHVTLFDWEGTKALFGTHPSSAFPFDVFAASFYLTSRYEEYLPHLRDHHDRFEAESSLAYQKNFLSLPLVNIWAEKLEKLLLSKFPSLETTSRSYRFVSTLDIDNAWAYIEKGVMRTVGAYARSLGKLNMEEVADRTKALIGLKKDPFDTYQFQIELKQKYKFHSIYFILLGEYGENDKNVSPSNRRLRSLIKYLADYAEVGIHPSYASNKELFRLKKEISTLSKILKREVTKSRQHFLILKLPGTYRNLLNLDITDDYSMGYANFAGFRASICTPYYFYDLDQEQATGLRIHPFAVMDATLKYYMKLEADQAMNYIKPLIEQVKKVNGDFISLWHNESLSENKIWAGWKEVYIQLVEEACR